MEFNRRYSLRLTKLHEESLRKKSNGTVVGNRWSNTPLHPLNNSSVFLPHRIDGLKSRSIIGATLNESTEEIKGDILDRGTVSKSEFSDLCRVLCVVGGLGGSLVVGIGEWLDGSLLGDWERSDLEIC